ncbi:SCO family protein [Metabacillus herbersteinensis]|uniref:SCO family protein n=1 Tax=Metabacillus herbersteinensis TaxID=283816 RepID=A0ABV6GLM7_9BACI
MNRTLRLCFIVWILLILFALTACSSNGLKDSLNYEVKEFEFTNQDQEIVRLEDLKGKIWVADFIFTSCETVCPPMTAHMTELQQKVSDEGIEAEFISFSVDPEIDTPIKLKQFAENYDLTFDNWNFLTGYTQDEIEKYALDSFKQIVQKPKSEDQVIHQTLFYLVDQNGTVVKDYSGVENTPYDQIIEDMKTLQKPSK